MHSQKNSLNILPTHQAPSKGTIIERVRQAANRFIVASYPFGVMGGIPSRMVLGKRRMWIVPIVFTSPGYGPVGQVGHVAVQPKTLRIAGSTPRAEVTAALKKSRETKREAIDAAFLQARTS